MSPTPIPQEVLTAAATIMEREWNPMVRKPYTDGLARMADVRAKWSTTGVEVRPGVSEPRSVPEVTDTMLTEVLRILAGSTTMQFFRKVSAETGFPAFGTFPQELQAVFTGTYCSALQEKPRVRRWLSLAMVSNRTWSVNRLASFVAVAVGYEVFADAVRVLFGPAPTIADIAAGSPGEFDDHSVDHSLLLDTAPAPERPLPPAAPGASVPMPTVESLTAPIADSDEPV